MTAEPVTNAAGDLGLEIADGLESLADKSLIRIEPAPSDAQDEDAETRFSLHPLLREYALERLAASGEIDPTEQAFAAECVGIAEAARGTILGEAGEVTMRRIDREERNLRATVDWAISRHDADDRPPDRRRDVALVPAARPAPRGPGPARACSWRSRAARIPRVRINGLAAEGSLAYWMDDIDAARFAY